MLTRYCIGEEQTSEEIFRELVVANNKVCNVFYENYILLFFLAASLLMDNGVDVPGGGGGGGEVPVVSLSTDDGEESLQCTVQFQCGLLREEETFYGYDVEILCHDSLLEYVCDMLSFKVRPHSPCVINESSLYTCLSFVVSLLLNIYLLFSSI